ncbi:hypothetical protein ACFV0T_40285 [Streptomyces sp. NPDC059582]|uniref:hypothetical protein n=1 Tax=Streptomyces sp. NPDC059582 TaxID=3346875 RepID=UPI00369173EC
MPVSSAAWITPSAFACSTFQEPSKSPEFNAPRASSLVGIPVAPGIICFTSLLFPDILPGPAGRIHQYNQSTMDANFPEEHTSTQGLVHRGYDRTTPWNKSTLMLAGLA